MATTLRGVVTARELSESFAERPLSARGDTRGQALRRLEDLVLEPELERRFVARGGLEDPEYRAWHGLLERRLAARALDRALAAEARPSAEAVTAAAAREPVVQRPARWRLRNLFVARPDGADATEVDALRAEAEALRRRLVAGEDFGELARQHSDSQTRLRGGRLGFATLEALRPEYAAALSDLEEGELSPVLETADGWTVLRVDAVQPGGPEPAGVVERRVTERLHRERLDHLRTQSEAAARERLAPRRVADPGDGPAAVLVRLSGGLSVTRRDLTHFARDRRLPRPLDAEALDVLLDQLIERHIRADAARARGLLDAPEFRDTLAAESRVLRAELELRTLVTPRLEEPSAAAVDTLYRRRAATLVVPPRFHLRLAELRLDPRQISSRDVETFETVAARARRAEASLEEIVASVPSARLVDSGWMTPKQIFRLGKAIDRRFAPADAPADTAAAKIPAPGTIFGPVQEGRLLRVVEVLGHRPRRSMTRAEAAPRLHAALTADNEKVERRAVRREILDALELEILEPSLRRTARGAETRDAANDDFTQDGPTMTDRRPDPPAPEGDS
ncbi:MAG: peptidylprolyl isomerase [Acidobacteriota bacterium]